MPRDPVPEAVAARRRWPGRVVVLVAAAVVAGSGTATGGTGGTGGDSSAGTVAGAAPQEATVRTLRHGPGPDQVLDLHVPTTTPSGTTVVLVHGGFWRQAYRRDLMDPLVPSLLARGHVVANVEYRRVGGDGGWPTTLLDVAAGVDALADVPEVDPARVVVVGHSAGGHLAVWAASRHRLPTGAPGADPAVRPCAAVAQAGVVDLAGGVGLGDGALDGLLADAPGVPGGPGGPDRVARLAVADPVALLPVGVPVTLVHGDRDRTVPVAQSEAYLAAATAAGDRPRLVVGAGDHFAVIDPDHALWDEVLAAVATSC